MAQSTRFALAGRRLPVAAQLVTRDRRALPLRTSILNCPILAPFALFVRILYALPREYIIHWCLNQRPIHVTKGVLFEYEPRGYRCCSVMYYALLRATSYMWPD